MKVLVLLFCLIQYVYGFCYVHPDENGHVSAADLDIISGDTIYGGWFESCYTLESIEIPDKIKTIAGKAFAYTYNLKNVTFLGDITMIGYSGYTGAFDSSGEYVDTMSITFLGNVGTIDKYAFWAAGSKAKFMSVDFRKNVNQIGNEAFKYSGVVSLTYHGTEPSFGYNVFQYSQYEICRQDESPPGMDLDTRHGTYKAASDSFNGCKSLTSVTIEDGVTEIVDYAFYDTSLTSVTIPSSVTSIGDSAFESTDMVSVTYSGSLPSFGDDVFKFTQYEICRLDETPPGLDLSTGHGTYNGASDSFHGCKSLTSVTIEDGVTEIVDSAFEDTALTSVTIADSVTSIGAYAFERTALTSVILPSNITEIGRMAFYKTTSLTSVDTSEATSLKTIGNSAFSSTALTSINLSGATSLKTIGALAFKDTALTSINLPNSVTTIGTDAFPTAVFVKQHYMLQNTTVSTILNSFTLQELRDHYRGRDACPN